MTKTVFLTIFLCFLILISGFILKGKNETLPQTLISNPPTPIPSPTPTEVPVPQSKILRSDYHIFETFNNCGPASLSMALSYFGIRKSQEELGQALRPYQNPQGNNDDKDVTLVELASEAEKNGLIAFYRPNGDVNLLKQFIAVDIPVIAETLLTKNDDIGHFRVIKGFDENTKLLHQDDSYQGRNLTYSYDNFEFMWEKFNNQYLVMVPKDKQKVAEQILGKNLDQKYAWEQTAQKQKSNLEKDPADTTARFNLSVSYYHLGKYREAVNEFENVENQLPFRTLWYRIEPILSYYELGDYQRVFSLTDKILNGGNRAYTELYIIRGNIYIKQGKVAQARTEFENAYLYNKSKKEARDALLSIN